MNMGELIALATVRSGKSKGELARELGYEHQSKLTRLGAGQKAPNASEIVYLAEVAKLPPLETLADIEIQAHPELASAWKRALKGAGSSIKKLYFVVANLPRLSTRHIVSRRQPIETSNMSANKRC